MINPAKFRQNIRGKLTDLIGDNFIASNIEIGVFNYTLEKADEKKIIKTWNNDVFQQLYIDRLRTIYINLESNAELLEKIKKEEITAKEFVYMTHQEMNPERWRELIERKNILDANKNNTNLLEANTDMFTCPKCKSKRCNFYTLQTRSADEPETIFISCLDCGKKFRKG